MQGGTVVEDFETGWGANTGSVADDTVNYKTGTKSLKVTSAEGTSGTATKIVSLDLSSSYYDSYIWVYLWNELTEQAGVILYASTTTDFSKHFTYAGSLLHKGWNRIHLRASNWTNVGSASWSDPIIRMRVRLNAASGQTPSASFDSWTFGAAPSPAVLLMFDDGSGTVPTLAAPAVAAVGGKATAYIITDNVGAASYMTAAQIQALDAAGWDIGNHTTDHSDLTALTQEQVQAKLSGAKDALDALGLTRASSHVAYPYGLRNATVLAAMTAESMTTGRIVSSYPELTPPAHPQEVTCYNIAYDTSLATAKGWVASAVSRGEVAALLLHHIVTGTPASSQWALADLTALLAYIRELGVPMLTITEWWGLTAGSALEYGTLVAAAQGTIAMRLVPTFAGNDSIPHDILTIRNAADDADSITIAKCADNTFTLTYGATTISSAAQSFTAGATVAITARWSTTTGYLDLDVDGTAASAVAFADSITVGKTIIEPHGGAVSGIILGQTRWSSAATAADLANPSRAVRAMGVGDTYIPSVAHATAYTKVR